MAVRIVISEFMSLDGVVQAPGGPDRAGDPYADRMNAIRKYVVTGTLADELQLMLMPVILGGGKTIFPEDGAIRPLELVSAVTTDTGAQVCTYRPVGHG
jgi:hypothetical protein